MSNYTEKGVEKEIPGTQTCDVCGNQSVIRRGDGHRYCYHHNARYNAGKSFEQIKAEYVAEKTIAEKEAKK